MDQENTNMDKQEANDESDQNKSGVVSDVIAPNIQQISDIFKLDIDCFEELFDYLSIKDLVSIGKTCKRLQHLAGYCFHLNYSNRDIECLSNGFTFNFDVDFDILFDDADSGADVTHFTAFIRKMWVNHEESLQYFMNIQSKLRRLKHIEIWLIDITQLKVDRMKEMLSKVKVLRMMMCALNSQEIIANCPKLRCLQVDRCETNFDWTVQKYATLAYFEFTPSKVETESIERVAMFLEENPNIRKFATSAEYLWANRGFIKNASGIQLDDLAIWFRSDTKAELGSFCQLLNELHERSVYRRLQLYIEQEINQERVDQLTMVNGLVKLHILEEDSIKLSAFQNLKELHVRDSNKIADLEEVVNNSNNLKRIHFDWLNLNHIFLFARSSPALEKIKVDQLYNFSKDSHVIDLPSLNSERQHLPNAQKITLYVKEEVYLTTKWAINETNLDFIRLKREESFNWDHDFRL